MKKGLSFVLMICVLLLAVCLFGCKDDEGAEIVKIEVRTGSLKQTYQLDEKLDLSSVYIVVFYSNNVQEPVNVTLDMLEGFDTSTCTSTNVSDSKAERERIIRIRYQGFVTSDWYYTVVYKDGKSENVTTKARLYKSAGIRGMDFRIPVEFVRNDIKPIYGMTFDVTYDPAGLKPASDFFVGNLANWEFTSHEIGHGEFSCVYYATPGADPLSSDKTPLFTLIFGKPSGEAPTVNIKNIVVSDRENLMNLPDATVKII